MYRATPSDVVRQMTLRLLCLVEIVKWRHRREVCYLGLHLFIFRTEFRFKTEFKTKVKAITKATTYRLVTKKWAYGGQFVKFPCVRVVVYVITPDSDVMKTDIWRVNMISLAYAAQQQSATLFSFIFTWLIELRFYVPPDGDVLLNHSLGLVL